MYGRVQANNSGPAYTLIREDGAVLNTAEVITPAELDAVCLSFFGPPVVPRRLIRKSTIVARLTAAGKIDAAMAALMSRPASFARWVAADWPNIYFDDPEAVALMTAIGANVSEIMAPE